MWFDVEVGISDPGLAAIPVALLGVGAPIGAYFLDQPDMDRGVPAAISAGLFIGAGEGLGIASFQMVRSDEPWGFKELARSMAIGSTLGLVGGYAVGVTQEPSPMISAFASSGVVWGSAIGSMFGLGAAKGEGFSEHNDTMSLGGLIGYNVGLGATAGLSTVFIPSPAQIGWMWGGAGIGAAVSLPIFLFYAGEDTPPARRGFLFMGTATTLGILAGAVFAPGGPDLGQDDSPRFASITGAGPMAVPGGAGFQLVGTLF